MSAKVEFDATFTSRSGQTRDRVVIEKVIVGGWTGRDKAALQHHIDELAKIGVKPPAKTPLFYRVGVSRLSVADAIEVIGDGSSGEVEYVLVNHKGRIWVGAGSDHTDRVVEHMGITVAKQLCDKPIATEFWPLDEVEGHWDKILIRSTIHEDGKDVVYQDGGVAGLLSPAELLGHLRADGGELGERTLMFGGTCGAIGGVRFSPRFSLELTDPVLNRRISHSYDVVPVPILG
ncbi:DUF2848 domain-containing protein [Defluviimonas sp. WL0075]|uniref:DUF2848 domain-containing protein n=1 Tax=Albidovulum sediminicola TaxID=2984331 RepID=A0ABT2Z5C1_9RHOB|nr:DUF2848 domain-containing protein [Defluviimonas sp. WL0075]MCV2866316.1 DUF2848 domain-containing protein [Defluviimonas sp. WL0075]